MIRLALIDAATVGKRAIPHVLIPNPLMVEER